MHKYRYETRIPRPGSRLRAIATLATAISLAGCSSGPSRSSVTPTVAPQSIHVKLTVQHLNPNAVVTDSSHPLYNAYVVTAQQKTYFFPASVDVAFSNKTVAFRSYGRLYVFDLGTTSIRHSTTTASVSSAERSQKHRVFEAYDALSGTQPSVSPRELPTKKRDCPDCLVYVSADLRRQDGVVVTPPPLVTPRQTAQLTGARRPLDLEDDYDPCLDAFSSWYGDSNCTWDYYSTYGSIFYYAPGFTTRERVSVKSYTWAFDVLVTTDDVITTPSSNTLRWAFGAYVDIEGGYVPVILTQVPAGNTDWDFVFGDSDTDESVTNINIYQTVVPVSPLVSSYAALADDV
jgi:hypothetical protein